MIKLAAGLLSLALISANGGCEKAYWTFRVEADKPIDGDVTLTFNGKEIASGPTRLPYQFRTATKPISFELVGTGKTQLHCSVVKNYDGNEYQWTKDSGKNRVRCMEE